MLYVQYSLTDDEHRVVTDAQVFRENIWASDIEWPVVRHSREKNKILGCFERERLLL